MRWGLLLVVALLAGCAGQPPAPAPLPAIAPVEAPSYELNLRVSEERPDGPALAAAQVHVGLLDETGALQSSPALRFTDPDGWVHLSWSHPVRVALQAVAADAKAWTVEGAVLSVGDAVATDDPVLVSERDAYLPLYHAALAFTGATSFATAVAQPGPDGMTAPLHSEVLLQFPDGLQQPYLARLASARVELSWQDTATSHADLSAGLAWDGLTWVRGDDPGTSLLPAPRSASYTGQLPSDGRPADLAAARLQATALAHTAVVGDVPVQASVELGFGDHRPAQLPDPRCGHNTLELPCLIPLS